MNQFKTIAQVWNAIDAGLTVHWASDAYALTVEPCHAPFYERLGKRPDSYRRGQALRVTCTANYFGSWLLLAELPRLYLKPDAERFEVCQNPDVPTDWYIEDRIGDDLGPTAFGEFPSKALALAHVAGIKAGTIPAPKYGEG